MNISYSQKVILPFNFKHVFLASAQTLLQLLATTDGQALL